MGSNLQILHLPVSELRPNPHQPRLSFDETGLRELSASIRRHGILQPLTVRQRENGWELIAGERRLRAARMAGLTVVPCIQTEASSQESALLALVENLQRQDLHYFEEAAAIASYIHTSGCTQEEIAGQLGRAPSSIANKLRLLRLSTPCKEALLRYNLTERHARALLRLENPEDQVHCAIYIGKHKLNVAQSEQYIERYLSDLQKAAPATRRTFILKDVKLFLNSIDRGMRMVREAGIDVQCQRQDSDEELILTIRIPRQQMQTLKNRQELYSNYS